MKQLCLSLSFFFSFLLFSFGQNQYVFTKEEVKKLIENEEIEFGIESGFKSLELADELFNEGLNSDFLNNTVAFYNASKFFYDITYTLPKLKKDAASGKIPDYYSAFESFSGDMFYKYLSPFVNSLSLGTGSLFGIAIKFYSDLDKNFINQQIYYYSKYREIGVFDPYLEYELGGYLISPNWGYPPKPPLHPEIYTPEKTKEIVLNYYKNTLYYEVIEKDNKACFINFIDNLVQCNNLITEYKSGKLIDIYKNTDQSFTIVNKGEIDITNIIFKKKDWYWNSYTDCNEIFSLQPGEIRVVPVSCNPDNIDLLNFQILEIPVSLELQKCMQPYLIGMNVFQTNSEILNGYVPDNSRIHYYVLCPGDDRINLYISFGDGQSVLLENLIPNSSGIVSGDILHYYNTGYNYKIEIISTNIEGFKNSIFKYHKLNEALFASGKLFESFETVAGIPFELSCESITTVFQKEQLNFKWDFNFENSIFTIDNSEEKPIHEFLISPSEINNKMYATKNIAFIVESWFEGIYFSDTVSHPLIIRNPIYPDFQISPAPDFKGIIYADSAPFEIEFDAQRSQSYRNSDLHYQWVFGDGNIKNGIKVKHTFQEKGTYNVKLTIDDGYYLNSISKQINIDYDPLNYCSKKVIDIEYFLDKDPGFGNGTSINLTENNIVSEYFKIDLQNVTTGLHRLYIRAKDDNDNWSLLHSRPIMVTSAFTLPKIAKTEYFVDSIVENGNGLGISFNPSIDISLNKNINLSSIQEGLHHIYFRSQDLSGRWSIIHSKPILVKEDDSDLPITKVEYFFDNDPGINSGRSILFTSANDVTIATNLPLDTLSMGTHSVWVRAKSSNGLWSYPQFSTFSIEGNSQKIYLRQGWNIVSSALKPDSADLKFLFQKLLNTGSLVKVQDEGGNSFEDLGINGGWQNNIGTISVTEGYKIKVNRNDTLKVSGTPVTYPYAIPLKKGWNIAGYPQQTDFSGMNLVQQLADKGTLIKVQDEGGNSIEDWGIYGSWQNNIGNFMASEGYKIKVSADDTLWIYENYPNSSAVLPEFAGTTHFKRAFEGYGFDHMNINLVGLHNNIFQAGDELAIFDGATCVGAATLMPHHLESQTISIATSATDNLGMPGFAEGNPFVLKLWNSKNSQEFKIAPEIVKGTSTFIKNETSVVSLEKYTTIGFEGLFASEQPEINCYPNPFNDEITIEINLFKETEVQVEVLNQLGQLVKYINTGEQLNRGSHRLIWDGTNSGRVLVAPGIYLIRMKLNDTVYYSKVIYSK